MNLFDCVEKQARARPLATALIDGEVGMTFGELEASAAHAAALLARQGVSPGDVIGLATASSWLHLVLTLALARLGAISLCMPSKAVPAAQQRQVVRDFGVKAVLGEDREQEPGAVPAIAVEPEVLRAPAPRGAPLPPSVAADELPWRICLTSGTTGPRKGIAMRHASFVRVCALRAEAMNADDGSRFLSRIGLITTPVLIRTMCHLFAGGAVVFHRGEINDLFDVIDDLAITHVYAPPVVLRHWLEHFPAGRAPLAGIVHFGVGGGRLPPTLAQEAMKRLTPNIHVSYGSTETGAIARADPETLLRAPESVGRVVPWVEVQIVDESGQALPAGEPGRVRIRGEEVASGYYGAAADGGGTDKGFRDGWFYPGDIGRLAPDGLLYVEGRNDDVINLGGPKVNTRIIENALDAHAAVAEAAVFAVSTDEGMGLIAAVVSKGPFDEGELLRHLKERGVKTALRIVQVPSLPRNEMGKVLKQDLARAVRIKRH